MHASVAPIANAADLSACENEPIHIPGAIQPHGALLAVDEETGRIVNVSANAGEILGRDAASLLNSRIDAFLGTGLLQKLRETVRGVSSLIPSFADRLVVNDESRAFDLIAHRSDRTIIIELEPAQPQSSAGFEAFFSTVRAGVTRIQDAGSLESLADIVVDEIARISGFERVMLYRFDRDWNGEVIAERRPDDLSPFLGLHYPASDIPRQARELYRRNMLRLIPDAAYDPVPLVPAVNPLTNRSLDLSMSTLRSVSPVHLEYLKNMDVRATLTVSLIKHGQLWGMIAAHHRTPRFNPFRVRLACELIGRTASLQITTLEDAAENELRLRLRSLQPSLIEAVNREGQFTGAVATGALLQIAGAEGAAIKTEGEPQLVGRTPRNREIRQIIAWLEERDSSDGDQPFASDCLPLENPHFAALKDVACGLLAVPLTTSEGGWILWFRPEVVRTVSWGGDPNKPVADDGKRISPRKSFEAWKEQVSLHSLPWNSAQIEAGVELRRLLSDVMMRRAREYAKINAELARSNQDLESFAHIASHDLKEPLRGIHHYAQFLEQDYGERLDDHGRRMLSSVGLLAERMERQIQSLLELSQVGHDQDATAGIEADAVLDEALLLLAARLDGFDVTRSKLPRVRIAPARLREVFVNLIGNAIKYNDKPAKRIEIGVTSAKWPAARPLPATSRPPIEQMATLFVRDNGIGIKEKHLETVFRMFKRLHGRDEFGGGTGAGLALARKIVEQQGGAMWVESVPNEGSTFYFTVPQAQE